jgi:16S rRNA (adenine1518-N6/adenine1519-N6)-dimethyltransferase
MKHAAKKSLGQNFLKSKKALSDMVNAGKVSKGDTVLEIGPGKGALTEVLLQHAGKVVAIEKDKRLIPLLEEKFAGEITNGRLELIYGDILEERIELPKNYKLIANIPYYITGALFRMFLEAENKPNTIVFLVQKEVAERAVAKDGKESLLSLSIKAYGTPKYISKVSKQYFSPVPKVDSAIVAVYDISSDNFKKAGVSEKQFFRVIKTGFAAKRKVLAKNLSEIAPKDVVHKACADFGLDAKVRAEDLPMPAWLALTKALSSYIHS